jgi:hypothetical protein
MDEEMFENVVTDRGKAHDAPAIVGDPDFKVA